MCTKSKHFFTFYVFPQPARVSWRSNYSKENIECQVYIYLSECVRIYLHATVCQNNFIDMSGMSFNCIVLEPNFVYLNLINGRATNIKFLQHLHNKLFRKRQQIVASSCLSSHMIVILHEYGQCLCHILI